jgi:hypothetical protein
VKEAILLIDDMGWGRAVHSSTLESWRRLAHGLQVACVITGPPIREIIEVNTACSGGAMAALTQAARIGRFRC